MPVTPKANTEKRLVIQVRSTRAGQPVNCSVSCRRLVHSTPRSPRRSIEAARSCQPLAQLSQHWIVAVSPPGLSALMYQQPWGQGQPQQHPGPAQQGPAAQPWAQQPPGQPQGDPGAYAAHGQPNSAPAWGAQPAAAAPAAAPSGVAGVQTAAQIAAYQQYYQQQTSVGGGPAGAATPPSAATYYGASGAAPSVRTWAGTVTQIIPPNYGVIDGDAYYINAVVVGEIPKVGSCLVAPRCALSACIPRRAALRVSRTRLGRCCSPPVRACPSAARRQLLMWEDLSLGRWPSLAARLATGWWLRGWPTTRARTSGG